VLLTNPHLRYKAKTPIQNDSYLGRIYFGHLSDRKVALKEFNDESVINCEMSMLSSLEHTNILKFLLKFEALNDRYFLVTEFAEKFSRGAHLKTPDDVKDGMKQLTSAVQYLQKLKIVHCQLIPQNIFVINGGGLRTFKVTNFSKAIKIQAPAEYNGEYFEKYSAPEIPAQGIVYYASDIWSLGCLFFHFATGKDTPAIKYEFQMNQMAAQINLIGREWTNAILQRDLLTKMLQFDSRKRLTPDEVQAHPFFWKERNMADLITDVSKTIEKDDKQFAGVISRGSHKVIGESWVARLDAPLIAELKAIKKNFNSGKKKGEFKETSIINLINTIRNIIVHSRSPMVIKYMGESDEELMSYLNRKFPHLIAHIYNAKIQYENKENM
jgi:serine/threonine protein kinase